MLQINVRKHPEATTIALRGLLGDEDMPELIEQLEFIIKFDNKLHLVFDCTRLVNAQTSSFDLLYNVFLRISYLRKITFCGMNDIVKKAVERSRVKDFVVFEGAYNDLLDSLHTKIEEHLPEESPTNL